MLTRTPLAKDGSGDHTVMGSAPGAGAPAGAESGSRALLFAGLIGVVTLAAVGLAGYAYLSNQTKPAPRLAVIPRLPTPTPTPEATPTPEPTPTPTPVPVRLPTGSLLISSDVDAKVTIDGRIVTRIKASGTRRFDVAPG